MKYYTMALDKGWHLPPTNNQDNHKGKWGNANDARGVIITDDFSQEGIYEAIRNYRMYATEDKNLEIDYIVNGELLGAQLPDDVEQLDVSVTVSDPDASNSIAKVEIIVNSGKVAHVWDDPAELAAGQLTAVLAPDYSYYYVRVTEADGDIAVTAPVWVGEVMKLGVSSVECGTATPVTGEAVSLTTTLFNSETEDAAVTSIAYAVKGGEILHTDVTGYTIPASGTLAVDFRYTPSGPDAPPLPSQRWWNWAARNTPLPRMSRWISWMPTSWSISASTPPTTTSMWPATTRTPWATSAIWPPVTACARWSSKPART